MIFMVFVLLGGDFNVTRVSFKNLVGQELI